MVVNAITKSGTQRARRVVRRLLPRRQVQRRRTSSAHACCRTRTSRSAPRSAAPISRDRIHFFGDYEYEREPKTYTLHGPVRVLQHRTRTFATRTHKALGRLDYQFTPQSRLNVRVSGYHTDLLRGGGATSHPSAGGTRERVTPQYAAPSRRSSAPVGQRDQSRRDQLQSGSISRPSAGRADRFPITPSASGMRPSSSSPATRSARTRSTSGRTRRTVRDDFTTAWEWGGRHDMKIGGEYFRFQNRVPAGATAAWAKSTRATSAR